MPHGSVPSRETKQALLVPGITDNRHAGSLTAWRITKPPLPDAPNNGRLSTRARSMPISPSNSTPRDLSRGRPHQQKIRVPTTTCISHLLAGKVWPTETQHRTHLVWWRACMLPVTPAPDGSNRRGPAQRRSVAHAPRRWFLEVASSQQTKNVR